MRRVVLVSALVFVAAGCGRNTSPEAARKLAQLAAVEGCQEVEESIRKQLIHDMEEQIDRNLEYALTGANCYRLNAYEDAVGANQGYSPAPPSSAPASSGAKQYSTTNNQVAGVDEADMLKNDAEYLYVLGEGKLNIIRAWPAAQAHVVSRTAITGEPKKLFVEKGRAVVLSALTSGDSSRGGWYGRECTYGYDCNFTGDGYPLLVSVFDLTDLSSPKLIRETRFSGSLLSSRRIGDAVHVVVTAPQAVRPTYSTWPEDLPWTCNPLETFQQALTIQAAFAKLRAENRAKLEALTIADFFPSVVDTRHEASGDVVDANLLSECRNFYAAKVTEGAAFLSVASFDLTQSQPMNVTTVLGRPGAVYASADALYVTARHEYSGGDWFYDSPSADAEASTVHKFAFVDGPATAYQGTGIVKGRVLNQFAMDEHDGFFRVATTSGHLPSPDAHSTVTVLQQGEQGLETVGILDQIAPTEDIRSVRFDGRRAFIVTFKKTDPLFVIDLADPRRPFIAGELKIPGFSTYMHMIDDTHLLAMGLDAEDHGSFAYFQGVLLQIFDVSDPKNPTMTARHVIGTRGSSSEALTNHLAFNYFGPKKLLAVPMTVCEDSNGGGSYGQKLTFGGLMLFDIDVTQGIGYRGGVPHAAPAEGASACNTWWTNATSQVKRSVFMDDFVYSVAEDLVQVAPLSALGTPIVSLPLE
ncbi:MAG: beta-propeller domain-containing protein [Myxococcota bacterium]